MKLSESETQLTPTAKASTEAGSLLDNGSGVDRSVSYSYLRFASENCTPKWPHNKSRDYHTLAVQSVEFITNFPILYQKCPAV